MLEVVNLIVLFAALLHHLLFKQQSLIDSFRLTEESSDGSHSSNQSFRLFPLSQLVLTDQSQISNIQQLMILALPLIYIFSVSFATNVIPHIWRLAFVLPVFKGGESTGFDK